MDDVQGDIDGDPEEQTEDEIVIIPVKDNRSKTVKGFSNKDRLKIMEMSLIPTDYNTNIDILSRAMELSDISTDVINIK